jgi:hypothetical protein
MASLISTGMLRTPDGKAVADSPSADGRAPAPPEWNDMRFQRRPFSAPSPAERPAATMFHNDDVPSAGTRPGRIWCRQPNTVSGNIWPTTWRAFTAYGCGAFSTQPAGALTRTTSSEPALLGTSGPMMQRTPKDV